MKIGYQKIFDLSPSSKKVIEDKYESLDSFYNNVYSKCREWFLAHSQNNVEDAKKARIDLDVISDWLEENKITDLVNDILSDFNSDLLL
ncbi:hypothetical protein [Xanthocytophaga flava]|uniref:hypothetical protein n=1 Tax=Xanthocytophaga flava TaxID=3048013 RepID=UPI0028D1A7AB|nr:hypothetical protein [Xanthocytophaga flavus]MDJ1471881.1 hypothetical protein [Xanthocytophaga flavus]